MTDDDFCECDDPAICDCGKPLPFTGRAAPSGLLMDRWSGCGMCDQFGRVQFRDTLRSLVSQISLLVIAFAIGYFLGSRGWRP
jgi:hypothetical protein